MNKDQLKGTIKQAAGKVQEHAGRIIGNKTQEAKGIGKQVSGKITKEIGDIKENIKDAAKKH